MKHSRNHFQRAIRRRGISAANLVSTRASYKFEKFGVWDLKVRRQRLGGGGLSSPAKYGRQTQHRRWSYSLLDFSVEDEGVDEPLRLGLLLFSFVFGSLLSVAPLLGMLEGLVVELPRPGLLLGLAPSRLEPLLLLDPLREPVPLLGDELLLGDEPEPSDPLPLLGDELLLGDEPEPSDPLPLLDGDEPLPSDPLASLLDPELRLLDPLPLDEEPLPMAPLDEVPLIEPEAIDRPN